MRIFILITAILLGLRLIAQQNDLLWLKSIRGNGAAYVTTMVEDYAGNLYVTGNFTQSINIGTYSFTSNGGQDIFLTKYSPQGQVLWAITIGGSQAENVYGLALSQDGNSIYISGQFQSNPCPFGGGLAFLSNYGNNDLFLAKYNTNNGTLVWTYNAAYGTNQQLVGYLAVDASNNILMLGKYSGSTTFNNGPTITPPSDLPSVQQCFITKFDANGNYLWHKSFRTKTNFTFLRTITATNNSYYISGQFFDSLYLDNLSWPLYSLSRDMVIFRTDYNGNPQWVRTIRSTGQDYLIRHYTDVNGFSFIAGYYSGPTLTIDSTDTEYSVKTCPNQGSNDIFLACYNYNGTLQWARNYGTSGDDKATGVFANSNHVVFTGSYTGNINFDGFTLSNNSTDAFMLEMDRNANVLGVNKAYGTSTEHCEIGLINTSNNNLFGGYFDSDTLRIQNKKIANTTTSTTDIFLCKFGKINVSFNTTNILCYGDHTGAIDITVTGDVIQPISYNWSGPNGFSSTNEDLTNLYAGWYKVTITDAIGAEKRDSVFISQSNPITLTFNIINTSCSYTNNGKIKAYVGGGLSPYFIQWSTGQTTPTISNLSAGWYYITVTDQNACQVIDSAQVSSPSPLTINTTITNPSCTPGNDGSIDITVNGGTYPYTYLWSNGSTNQDITGLTVGTYSVTVTDRNNCTTSDSYTLINVLAPSLSAIVDHPSCQPGNDGKIDLIVSGGTIPLTYQWNDGYTFEDRTNLASGSYSVTVTDANNCSAVKNNIVLLPNNAPSLSAIVQKPGCTSSFPGSIDLIVYNGTPPYFFSWNNGATTEDLNNLLPGNYSVTVTDYKNCTATYSTYLPVDSPEISLYYNGNTTFCEGDSLVLHATSLSNVVYVWNYNNNSIPNTNSPNFTAYQTGSYFAIAINHVGCKGYSDTITINVNPKPTINITASSNFICQGTTTMLTANGGINYQWNTNETTQQIMVQPSSTTTYTVTGTNNYGCTNTSSINIIVNQNPTISGVVTNEQCADNTGSIDITVSGGQSPYHYNWSNSSTQEDLINVGDGHYSVTVTDSYNCQNTYYAIIKPFIPITANLNTHHAIIPCVNIPNGEAVVYAQNGKSPYSYQWSNGITTPYNGSLGVGVNYVTVTDQCNHSVIDSIIVNALPSLQVQTNLVSPATCTGYSNGVATVTTINGVQPISYQWSNSTSTTNIASNLPSGWQYVSVTDACGTIVDSVNITVMPPMQASIDNITNVTCTGLSNGSASVFILDGVPPFTYQWSNGETTSTATNLPAGLNSVTVSDACGSTILSVSINVNQPLSIQINQYQPSLCVNDSSGIAVIDALGGTQPITYQWSNGETDFVAQHLPYGWNYATITDACTSLVDSVFIDHAPVLTNISVAIFNDASCLNKNDGQAVVILPNNEGVAPFQYTWSNSTSNSYYANDLYPGWNYVTVTDYCQTIVIDSFYVGYRTPLQITVNTIPTNCSFDSTGIAFAVTNNGVPPFTYNWSYGNNNDSILTNLPIGNYQLTVTDYCGEHTASFEIQSKPSLHVEFIKQDIRCYNQSTGQIVLIPKDGVAPYLYRWNYQNSTDSILTNLPAGTYHYTVTDICGSYTDSITIIPASEIKILTQIIQPTHVELSDGSIDITVIGGQPPYSYLWSNGATTEDISNISEGTYILLVTDYNHCVYVDTFNIKSEYKSIEIYNSFTPNGDGKNDVWNIKNIQLYPQCEIYIYNQWGVKVFESKGYTTPWDGTKDGKKLPAATYYYIIDLKNNEKPYTGNVTIIR